MQFTLTTEVVCITSTLCSDIVEVQDSSIGNYYVIVLSFSTGVGHCYGDVY